MTCTSASDMPIASASAIKTAQAIRDAVIAVLPDEWHVLPDGRAAHSVIAAEACRRLFPERSP